MYGPDEAFLTTLRNGLKVPLGQWVQYPVKPIETSGKNSQTKFRESEQVNFGFTGFGSTTKMAAVGGKGSSFFGGFGQGI